MPSIESIINRQINRWNSIAQTLKYQPHGEARPGDGPTVFSRRHPVICFSRDLGSGCRTIAGEVCKRLNYELFGSSIIDEIANDLKVQRRLVDSLDETGRSGLEMMLASYLKGREIDAGEYAQSLVRVLETLALKGGLVLLGRGASHVIGRRAALSVMVTCDLDVRVERLMAYDSIDEGEARRRIAESDEMRHAFMRKYFHTELHDPERFDLVVNTSRIPPSAGARLVFDALEARGFSLDELTINVAEAAPAS